MTVGAVNPNRQGQEVDVERAPGGIEAEIAISGAAVPLRDNECV